MTFAVATRLVVLIFVSYIKSFVFAPVCSYRDGSSTYDRQEEKTESRKFMIEFIELNVGGSDTKEKTGFGKIGTRGDF